MLAYAISPKAAAALLQASQTLTAPVDKFMQRTWEHQVPLYALSPPVVGLSTFGSESNIGVRPVKSRNPGLLLARLVFKIAGRVHRRRFDKEQLERLGVYASSVKQPTAIIDQST